MTTRTHMRRYGCAGRAALPALGMGVALALSGCASAPPWIEPARAGGYDSMTRPLDRLVQDGMQRTAVPGVVVAVVDATHIVWSKAYGVTSAGGTMPVDLDTRFRVGSISKTLTATEIMRLVDRGEVDLDAPVSSVLPDFKVPSRFADAKPITIRALLGHHSGLPPSHLRGMWDVDPADLSVTEKLLREEPLLVPPQSRYIYSNLDDSLLGRIVEVKTRRPFAAAIRQDLLMPLGMGRSAFERDAAVAGPHAAGHRKGEPVKAFGLRDAPAGALLADARDMSRFLEFVLAGGQAQGTSLMRSATLDRMFQPQFAGLPLDFGQRVGLDWMLSGIDVPGAGDIAWHAGLFPGYYALIAVARSSKLGVVVLANDETAANFAADVAAKALALALEAKTGQSAPSAVKPPTTRRHDVPVSELEAVAGEYAVFGAPTVVTVKDDYLSAGVFNTTLDLTPLADGGFALQKGVLGLMHFTLPDMTARFVPVGQRRFMVLGGLRAPIAFERVEKKPIPAAWHARIGSYTCDDGDDTLRIRRFELAEENGSLVVHVTSDSLVLGQSDAEGTVVLDPVSDDVATVYGGVQAEGGALIATASGVLRYSGYHLQRAEEAASGVR